ncbi:hypothetical protein [Rosenbergiella nectarea]|uniref:hypothetical protein n=1 Tax=Rosenbergiella nectarea TaxID=988801 RepID=UPI001F4E75F0|nr:hypothetical protein [Rosenbergiella nectarea]
MMLDAIDHVHVYVEDLPAAAMWYQQRLGFVHDEAFAEWYKQGGPYVIRCGAAALARLDQSTLDYTVVDHQLTWSVYFYDLSGNPLEVTCNDYAAATPVMIAATQKRS